MLYMVGNHLPVLGGEPLTSLHNDVYGGEPLTSLHNDEYGGEPLTSSWWGTTNQPPQ